LPFAPFIVGCAVAEPFGTAADFVELSTPRAAFSGGSPTTSNHFSQVGMLGKIFDELIDRSGDLFDVL
jgi:hypothetical protein